MDLFPDEEQEPSVQDIPLAWRMRPLGFEEFEGQLHLVGEGKPLRQAIEDDRIRSLILYGPPGTGKTALAHLIARRTGRDFCSLNAVTAGVNEIRKVVARAGERRRAGKGGTILFVDEIHRFNKVQQDALLPDVESGRITLIGASTENPCFALIPALRSRSQILEFKSLDREVLERIIRRALNDCKRGLGKVPVDLSGEALAYLVMMANGDARKALNVLEVAVSATAPAAGRVSLTRTVLEEVMQHKALDYDRDGDAHYDTASAFIKSMRGSDPDAAVYYLARMIEAGEDPRFIARRIVICAAEDVGNADPRALLVAEAVLQSVEKIGMPEGRILLAQAVTYVATAPKSNAAYLAVDQALADIRSGKSLRIPAFLRDTHYSGAKDLGRGVGYLYPHDFPGHFVPQSYLEEKRSYYRPSDQGYEKNIRERILNWDRLRKRKGSEQQQER
ncbi:MAG: replication-associated recombination protein A [Deltaproteobacteria bacterium]|nr:replication-associated recombination protein A [Deltaproteobacteria bacterium]